MAQDYSDVDLNSYGYRDLPLKDKEQSLLSPLDLDSMISSGAIGNTKLSSGAVSTSKIADGAVTEDQLAEGVVNLAMRGWIFTSTFSATNYRVVAWTLGTFTASDGTSYSIVAGNTGNMTALTYIYLDIGTSETVLQTTTTAANAVGSGKVLLAVAQNNSDTLSKATFQVFGGSGGNSIMVDNIVANSASTNEFVSNTAQIANAIITSAKINDVSFDKAVGGTLVLGGSGNASGVFSLKDSSGVEKIAMDNTGMTINSGKITLKNASEVSVIDSSGLVSNNDANFENQFTGAGNNQNITSTTLVDVTNGVLTSSNFARTKRVLVFYSLIAWIDGVSGTPWAGTATATMRIDSDDYASGANQRVIFEANDTTLGNMRETLSDTFVISLAAGTHTFQLRAMLGYLSNSKLIINSFNMGYLVLGS